MHSTFGSSNFFSSATVIICASSTFFLSNVCKFHCINHILFYFYLVIFIPLQEIHVLPREDFGGKRHGFHGKNVFSGAISYQFPRKFQLMGKKCISHEKSRGKNIRSSLQSLCEA
ncbi:hypothetical protein I3842_10G022200 [Carya illinoinensis]|uniref:Uncharacterized protein n=1 Tax=Carya illinoinensis TaxID=32201 RepID=A0A922J358_CARIL|nr:hypothetical protein I3842_10G022200 [Carya illinoinensis]